MNSAQFHKKIETKFMPTNEFRYFLYDPGCDGMVFFRSEEDRDAYAEGVIQDYLGDDWGEEVELICAGMVTHVSTQVDRVERPSDDELDEDNIDSEGRYWDSDWSFMCNYKLLNIEEGTEEEGRSESSTAF